MTDARIVMTTIDSADKAQVLARALLERHLAACVNIVERVQSIYRWEGAIESATEWLLLIKTQAMLLPQLESTLRELHSYELPEFLVLKMDAGSAEYLRWLATSVVEESTT